LRSSLQLLTLILVAGSITAFADQIVLKNGDRLTGTVVKSDAKELVLKTEFAGDVTIQFPAIQEIKTDQQLHVETKSGQKAVGAVSTADGKLEVATKTSGTVAVPKEEVVVLRNDAEQVAFDKAMHPGLLEGWNGGFNLGFGLTRGNSATKNLGLSFKAVRTGHRDKLSIYENTVYTTNDAAGASPNVTADVKQGGVRYDRDLTARVFAFVNADFMSDGLQGLNIRSVFGGGLGYHLIKGERTSLDILGGANYTHENYTASFVPPPTPPAPQTYTVTHNLAAIQVGDEFMHKLGKGTVITQNLYFFPNLSQTGEYRAVFNFGTVTKINKWFGWQNSFGDIFVSNPPTGKRQNDLFYTTGLNFSFTH
jgi:putative salt-induced outer membrane protein YdiY